MRTTAGRDRARERSDEVGGPALAAPTTHLIRPVGEAGSPGAGADRSPRTTIREHLEHYRRYIRISDAVIIALSVAIAQFLRFGDGGDDDHVRIGATAIGYGIVSAVIALAWFAGLQTTQSTDRRFLGEGAQQYSRVVNGTFAMFGALAIISVVFKIDIARGYLAVALPLGLALLCLERWCWRTYMGLQRRDGQLRHRVVVVGGTTLSELLDTITGPKNTTWEVVAVCRTDGRGSVPELGPEVPVVTAWRDVRQLVVLTGADTVAVSGAESIGLHGMRELSWDLEGLDVDLLVAPGVMDVAGPRMYLRPVSGLPLLHVDKPRYEGANQLGKTLFDKIGAGLIIFLASPVLLLCALAVRLTSRGPIFYTAERMGLNNEPFGMIKFRSMIPGADKLKDQLAAQNESEGGVLFKMRDDPRVTPVGRILRRYSLDELPQLFNVVKGDMSLVGPRPPLREEVEKYSGLVSRRMLVRPGMTGLWQVSGRSNLSWEESVRLDLTYVENWSLMQDVQILWRTARAVFGSDGAY